TATSGRSGRFASPAKMATSGRSALLSSTSTGPKSTLENSNPEEDDGQDLWSTILSEVSTHSRSKLPSGKNVLVMVVKQFQEYTEPGSGEDGTLQRRSEEEESVLLPLGDNTLTHNLGIPVVVVCTKCDAISTLEKEHDYRDEHLDLIQSHIRRFCLQYGASLVYTSVKEMKNLDILYKYLVHRLYGFPFHCPAQVVERDAVFIPSGWDNEKKIAILHENFQTVKADDSFEEVIVKPPVRKIVHEKEIQAEDDQVFLVKLQSLLAKQPAVTAGRPVDTTSRAPTGSPRTSNRSAAANVANAMPQSGMHFISLYAAGQTSEGVLANFFNSLLTKKAGTGGPGTPGGGNNTPGTVRKSGSKLGLSDVQAELDRISSRETDSDLPNANDTPATDGQDT
uniref:Dynein light intermediate chain n=1 Tax=Sander lucioperca TaxID=283035 RepID=A0A8D0D924_SANLU